MANSSMANNNSLIVFDQLATEVTLEIFDYLSCNDIIYAFFHLNERFKSILLQYQRYINHLETPTANFYFWQTLYPTIGSEIECLTINTLDFEFRLNLFPNLKSLIISPSISLNPDRIYSLFSDKNFNQLISLKIQSEIIASETKIAMFENALFTTIFHPENCLQTFEYSPMLYLSFKYMENLSINPNLRSLSLKTYDYIDAFGFLEYTPNLNFFKLIITPSQKCYRLHTDMDLSKVRLQKIDLTYESEQRDSFRMGSEDFLLLTNFLKNFSSSLIFLSMNLKDTSLADLGIDGIVLQQELLEPMILLKTFHLYVEQYCNENILSTFKNQFWLDHQWSVEMHDKYLYTVPFHFDHIKLTNSMILNSSEIWSRVTSIELSERINLNFIKQLPMKMPNLRTIIFDRSFHYDLDEFNENDIRLDKITTIHFKGQVKECVQECLGEILPNLKELILDQCFQKFILMINERIERLIIMNYLFFAAHDWQIHYIHFPNVKHIEIQLYFPEVRVTEILKNFTNLKTLTVHFEQRSYYKNHFKLPFDNLVQIDQMEILKEYQISEDRKCIRFIKKTNE